MLTIRILAVIYVLGVVRVEGFGVNNFRFLGKNTIFGDKLPQRIRISGTYFFEPDDYEEYDLNNRDDFFTNGTVTNGPAFSIDLLKGTGPWICTTMVATKLASLAQENFDTIEENVRKLENARLINGGFDFAGQNPKWPLDILDCTTLDLQPFHNDTLLADNYKGRVFSFSYTHEFQLFGPILFVDYFGAATFIYKTKLHAQDQMRSAGNPLRFCAGTNYNTQIYTPEPRPICPSEVSDKRVHEKGVLTVYKPNIVPITKRIGRCTKITTKIYSVSAFVFCCYKNKWGTQTVTNEAVGVEDCKRMLEDKTTPDGELMKSTGDENDIHNTYFTNRNKEYNFDGYGSRTAYVVDYKLDISSMKITTPTMTITTPWTSLQRTYLYATSFKGNGYMLVWNQFKAEKLCMFVPRLTTEAESIVYPDGDSLIEESSSTDAKETIFFTSQTSMATWDADNTMEITDLSKFNCIKVKRNEKIYLNKNGDLLKWQLNKRLRKAVKDEDEGADTVGATEYDYPHSGYTELQKNEEGTVTVTDNGVQDAPQKPSDSSIIEAAIVTVPNTNNLPKINTMTDLIKPNGNDTTTTRELLSYMNFKNVQTQNENVHIRLISHCKQSQVAWDLYTSQMEMSPSLAIGKHLKRAVEAMYAGNGYYAVKECEIVKSSVVAPSMFTNSTLTIFFNGRDVEIRKLVAKLAVLPSQNKCLSSPLIKFSLKNDGAVDRIGQLMRDGRINVGKIGALEDCLPDRVMAFNVGFKTYFFRDYALLTNEDTEIVLKMKNSIVEGATVLAGATGDIFLSPLQEFINSLILINMVDPLKEKKFKHTPVGSVIGVKMNRLYDKASSQSGVLDLMYENSRASHASRVWKETYISDYSGGVGGGFLSDMADLAESSVDNIITLADGMAAGTANFVKEMGSNIGGLGVGLGEGFSGLGKGLGEGLGDIGKGVGDGIGDVGDGLGGGLQGVGEGLGDGVAGLGKGIGDGVGSIAGGLGGILSSIILPVIVVAGVGVGGYFFYVKFIAKSPGKKNDRKKTDEPEDDDDAGGEEEIIYDNKTQNKKQEYDLMVNQQKQQNNKDNMYTKLLPK